MKAQDMQQTASQVSGLMKILSSENRLMILCQLVEGEKSVGTLAGLLGMRDAAMSQQLSLLRREGLVSTRREGQTIYYALARTDVRQLMEFLYATFCGVPDEENGHERIPGAENLTS
jgi:DNA-binding transcriptional ArsR family regulator